MSECGSAKERPKVLMVAYNFPPIGGSGTMRSLKFAKYLPECGWEPHVLTVRVGMQGFFDDSLLAELPPNVTIHRSWSLDPAKIERAFLWVWQILWKARLRTLANRMQPYLMMRWLALPDANLTWLVPAYWQARRIVAEQDIRLIYTTALPATAHLVGLWLSRTTAIPWVADYRDHWTLNPFQKYVTGCHRRCNLHMERRVLKQANRVVTVTAQMARALHALVPTQPVDKFICITNGYDPADFSMTEASVGDKERFKIAHVGNLYGVRTPKAFLEAADSLVQTGQVPGDELQVLFLGRARHPDSLPYEGRPWFRSEESVEHSQALQVMSGQDALLLVTQATDQQGMPAKLFEYMAVGRPIIALAPEGSPIERVIKDTKCGLCIPPDDVDAIRSMLLDAHRQWKRGEWSFSADPTVFAHYDRRRLTAHLAEVFNELI